jgi:hypothetical protein
MRAKQKVQWFIAGCLAVLLLAPTLSHYQAKWQFNRYRKRLEAAGEKVEVAELTPPIVPASTNAATVLRLAQGLYSFIDSSPSAMKFVKPGVARVAWREPVLTQEVVTGKPEVNVWPRLRGACQTNGSQIHELIDLLNNGGVQIPVEYSQSNLGGLDFLAPGKEVAVALGAVAILNFHEGDSQEAFECLKAEAAGIPAYTDSPVMICQLVGYAIESISFYDLWETLQSDSWSDDQWAVLQKQWSRMDYLAAAGASLAMERARSALQFDYARESKDGLNALLWGQNSIQSGGQILSDALEDPRKAVLEFYDSYPRYWKWVWIGSYRDERRYWEFMQAMIEATRDAGRRQSILGRLPEIHRADGVEVVFPFPQAASGFDVCQAEKPLTETLVRQATCAQTEAQIMVAAIALKRYHMAHNSYPGSLGELVPKFVDRIPIDYMDGHDLRYRLNPDGTYLLYSVGKDGVDNGGEPTSLPASAKFFVGGLFDGRDWVWPRAATPEEVKAFDLQMAAKQKSK